ncbi:hypothetical protein DPMN_104543 [Dreissena polymorpha]|uniref:EGF-like domain-containing protein n=1 Tax=Dreissena polymorpha TaxID=45954 RepID=A0A9D4HDB4_DREPO|nr:hypothetical protein DPMN_104543 [Dreissena polymorpha]
MLKFAQTDQQTNRQTNRQTDRQTGQKQYVPHYYNINECATNPCKNGATCNNLLNNYTELTATKNGATCINGQNKYTCTCAGGWQGTNLRIATDWYGQQQRVTEIMESAVSGKESTSSIQNQEPGRLKSQTEPRVTTLLTTTRARVQEDGREPTVTKCATNPCKNGATCINGQNKEPIVTKKHIQLDSLQPKSTSFKFILHKESVDDSFN